MDADKFSPKEKEVYTELEYQISILRININMFGIKGLKQTFSTQYNTLLCKIENLLGAYFRGPFVKFGLEQIELKTRYIDIVEGVLTSKEFRKSCKDALFENEIWPMGKFRQLRSQAIESVKREMEKAGINIVDAEDSTMNHVA